MLTTIATPTADAPPTEKTKTMSRTKCAKPPMLKAVHAAMSHRSPRLRTKRRPAAKYTPWNLCRPNRQRQDFMGKVRQMRLDQQMQRAPALNVQSMQTTLNGQTTSATRVTG